MKLKWKKIHGELYEAEVLGVVSLMLIADDYFPRWERVCVRIFWSDGNETRILTSTIRDGKRLAQNSVNEVFARKET